MQIKVDTTIKLLSLWLCNCNCFYPSWLPSMYQIVFVYPVLKYNIFDCRLANSHKKFLFRKTLRVLKINYTLICDWQTITYVTGRRPESFKYTQPLSPWSFSVRILSSTSFWSSKLVLTERLTWQNISSNLIKRN